MTQSTTLEKVGRRTLCERFVVLRERTEELAIPISAEDAQIQSMPDVSPTKWHLGHTSWFFETFLLGRDPSYRTPHPEFPILFNSYYNTVGEQHPRSRRGLLSRPSFNEVMDYRHHVTRCSRKMLESLPESELEEIIGIVTVGMHHEKQHQELMLTDILHVFWSNAMRPVYTESTPSVSSAHGLEFLPFEEGIRWVGAGATGFAYDNEYPRHRQFVHGFALANRPVTNGEFLEFIEADGYQRPELWLSDGWYTVHEQGWKAPMYWERDGANWSRMTLHGMLPADRNAPMCHLSFYEADAYARFRESRLPTEAEWEVAAFGKSLEGNLQESNTFVPVASDDGRSDGELMQMFGDVWEWTASAYLGYPGYKTDPGAFGEYNGKFMCNQFVLKGGSIATPQDHIRASYRNFFPPSARWQFTGLRLARDL